MEGLAPRVVLCNLDGAPLEREGGAYLLSGARWVLRGPSAQLAETAVALGGFCRHLADATVAELDFRNSVGRFELPHLGAVVVSSGKFGEGDFDLMLRELTEVAASLPFSAGQSGGLPHERTALARRQVLYHAFVYLRSLFAETAPRDEALVPALEAVLHEPHRRVERTEARVPLGQAHGVSPGGVARMLHGPMARVPQRHQGLALARALGGRLPVEVEEPRVRATFDTAENRLVRAFLERAVFIVDETVRLARRDGTAAVLRRRIEADAARMRERLGCWLRAGLWSEVGVMSQVPVGSTVLQRRRGYREVFRAFVRLGLASRVPLDEAAARDLLELKDIAQLYELWTYFRVVAELRELLGAPRRADVAQASPFALTVPWGYRVQWANGVEVLYNASFSRSGTRRSRSVPLRPDIVVASPGGLHVLDAKFRLRALPSLDDDEASATFLREDIVKMHAYRDALVGVASACVLYPGHQVRFFSHGGQVLETMDGVTEHHEGVGALGLAPTGHAGELQRFLRMCVDGSAPGHFLSHQAGRLRAPTRA